jgi:hypothetical protein
MSAAFGLGAARRARIESHHVTPSDAVWNRSENPRTFESMTALRIAVIARQLDRDEPYP